MGGGELGAGGREAEVGVAGEHEADAGGGAVDRGEHREAQAVVEREVVVELGADAVARARPAAPGCRRRSRPSRRGRRGRRESAPAQKPRPLPVTTSTRTSGSASAGATAWRYSVCMRPVHALRRSGRARVIVATRSATAYSIVLKSVTTGDPEGAEHLVGQLGTADHEVGEPRVAAGCSGGASRRCGWRGGRRRGRRRRARRCPTRTGRRSARRCRRGRARRPSPWRRRSPRATQLAVEGRASWYASVGGRLRDTTMRTWPGARSGTTSARVRCRACGRGRGGRPRRPAPRRRWPGPRGRPSRCGRAR